MIGQVRRLKPIAPPDLIRDRLNAAMRAVINRRPYWVGLRKRVVIPIPQAYTTGQVSLSDGSPLVTGTDTNWPTADVVNTVIPDGVPTPGVQWVTPASMAGIDYNSVLYVDGDGTPEIVPVRRVDNQRFEANFRYPHNLDCKVWMSSLVNRQFRVTSRAPIYNILAVPSATNMVLDNMWGNANLTNTGYRIPLMYIPIANDIKEIKTAYNFNLGLPMEVNVTKAQLDFIDPYREQTNNPMKLADNYRNACNNMTYELWPASNSQSQVMVDYYQEWPDMMADTDIPPPFLDPIVLVNLVLAEMLLVKITADDSNINPVAAAEYRRQYDQGFEGLVNADNTKAEQSFEWVPPRGRMGIGGANFWQANDPDCIFGFGGPFGGW